MGFCPVFQQWEHHRGPAETGLQQTLPQVQLPATFHTNPGGPAADEARRYPTERPHNPGHGRPDRTSPTTQTVERAKVTVHPVTVPKPQDVPSRGGPTHRTGQASAETAKVHPQTNAVPVQVLLQEAHPLRGRG